MSAFVQEPGEQYVHPSALPRLRGATQCDLQGVPTAADARSAAAVVGGLVTPKTTFRAPSASLALNDEFMVSFDANTQAENRIARLKRAVWASGHLHKLADNGFRPPVCWFVTLTYRGVSDWRPEHVSGALKGFRNWCKRHHVPCRYTWVAELQGRGAVHYHLLAWLPADCRSMPHWDKSCEGRPAWWPHGMSNTEKARAGVGYLMKYLSKLGEFHRFPKGLRLYGIGGLTKQGQGVRSWINLPEWAKALHGVGELGRVAGRLVVRATGEILASPYSVRCVPGGLVVRVIGTIKARWFDGPYSSVNFAGVNP